MGFVLGAFVDGNIRCSALSHFQPDPEETVSAEAILTFGRTMPNPSSTYILQGFLALGPEARPALAVLLDAMVGRDPVPRPEGDRTARR